MRRNIEGLPSELQTSFLQAIYDFGGVRRADACRQLAALLVAQKRIGEAQQVLELLKVQELRDFNRTTRAKINGSTAELDPVEQAIVTKCGSLSPLGKSCENARSINLPAAIQSTIASSR